MSTSAQGTFGAALRDVGGRMAMPLPERTRVLRELAYDLEALTERFVADGMTHEDARRRASDALVPDGETLSRLDRIHAPWYRRVTGRWEASALLRIETATLGLATALLVGVEGAVLVRTGLARHASPFLAPVLALGSLAAVTVVWKAFELWVKRDHTRLRGGLGTILALSGAALMTALGGITVDLHRLAAILERSPELAETLAGIWLIRESALLSVAILIALAGGLCWFVLTLWVAFVEAAHQEVLGRNTPTIKES